MWRMTGDLLLYGILLVLSLWDIRRREIPVIAFWLLGGGGLMRILLEPGCSMADKLITLSGLPISQLPGFIVLLISEFSGERIGKGDGWLLIALGLYMTARQVYGVMMLGICLGSMAGIPMTILRGRERAELPLVPFLMVGVLIVRWGTWIC